LVLCHWLNSSTALRKISYLRHPVPHHLLYLDMAQTDIYTLSLHDALPIFLKKKKVNVLIKVSDQTDERIIEVLNVRINKNILSRSEEHTSELQSRFDLVCRLLLEKKKIKHRNRKI